MPGPLWGGFFFDSHCTDHAAGQIAHTVLYVVMTGYGG